jgi:membrane-bound metal-dependent hydrolase YbcI (DUF457 family)
MDYKTLKLRKLRLRGLAIYQRRHRYFTVGLFIAMFLLLAWLAGPK